MAYVLGPPESIFVPRLEGTFNASLRRTGGREHFSAAAGRSASSWNHPPPSPRSAQATPRSGRVEQRPIYSSRGAAAPREEVTLRAPASSARGGHSVGAAAERRRGPLPSHSLAAERGVAAADIDLGSRRRELQETNVLTIHPSQVPERTPAEGGCLNLGHSEDPLLFFEKGLPEAQRSAPAQGEWLHPQGTSAEAMPVGHRLIDTPLRETFRKSASIPHHAEFPYGASRSWEPVPREGHPQYVFNPINSTTDKFTTDENGDVFQEKTDRTSEYLEPSIKDLIKHGRKKGIGEFRDICHPNAARWNRRFHNEITTNARGTTMFGKRQSHMTRFLDLAIRQGLDTTEMFAR